MPENKSAFNSETLVELVHEPNGATILETHDGEDLDSCLAVLMPILERLVSLGHKGCLIRSGGKLGHVFPDPIHDPFWISC